MGSLMAQGIIRREVWRTRGVWKKLQGVPPSSFIYLSMVLLAVLLFFSWATCHPMKNSLIPSLPWLQRDR
jgi:hypothetical protein